MAADGRHQLGGFLGDCAATQESQDEPLWPERNLVAVAETAVRSENRGLLLPNGPPFLGGGPSGLNCNQSHSLGNGDGQTPNPGISGRSQ